MVHQPIEHRVRFRAGAGGVFLHEAPQPRRIVGGGDRSEVQEQREADRQNLCRRLAFVDMVHRVAELLFDRLFRVTAEEICIILDGARDHVVMQALGLARALEHVEREAFGRAVIQPLFDGQAIALGLADLGAFAIKEQLVIEAGGWVAAEHADDLAGEHDAVDQILAGHFIIDAQRQPAHRPIHLPLQLAMAAGDGDGDRVVGAGADVGDGARRDVAGHDGHLQHMAGDGIDGQERRVGGAAFGAEGGQDDAHHIIIMRQYPQQRRIEHAAGVAFGGGQKLVIEAERIEESTQAGVVVGAEAAVGTERVAHLGQWLTQVFAEHFGVGNAVRHLAQPVHIVGKGDQARLHAGHQRFEGAADHGGAHHFAKGADVRQARWAITGFEDHRMTSWHAVRIARQHLAGFLEGPGLILKSGGLQSFGGDGHGFWLSVGFGLPLATELHECN